MKHEKIVVKMNASKSGLEEAADREPARGWTFFTNHTHTLLCLYRNPRALLREVAVEVGITERNVQRIVADLEEAGVLERVREGRRNVYEIHEESKLRHPLESDVEIGRILEVFDR